ncbi:hypothetical protein ACFFLM_04560 [Deinococcus oregonensis]|uniref:Uncharacterized protein n=1 Tax=Deinococcus oregonensis TaxID=1805970 RepID=A0ABV6AYF3_9DEIO
MKRAIVFIGHGSFPKRVYLNPNAMVRDIEKQFPGATVSLENDRGGDHSVLVEGVESHEFGMKWRGSHRFAFQVVPISDPENWEREG